MPSTANSMFGSPKIDFNAPSLSFDQSFINQLTDIKTKLQSLYKKFIISIPYKPKNHEVKQLCKKFISFEKQINDCSSKVQELLDLYEEK